MKYRFYISEYGVPREELDYSSTDDDSTESSTVIHWESLYLTDGTDKLSLAPAITEIGGGWYECTFIIGTNPWSDQDEDLVGVIDAGSHLADEDRYHEQHIHLRYHDIQTADWIIDITTDSAQWKLHLKDPITSDILLTKNLKDVNGNPVTSTAYAIGQQIKP